MKIDSEYLEIDLQPEYRIQHATTEGGRHVEIWDDGEIEIGELSIDVKTLEEIVRVYKLFRDRRKTYLANNNKT